MDILLAMLINGLYGTGIIRGVQIEDSCGRIVYGVLLQNVHFYVHLVCTGVLGCLDFCRGRPLSFSPSKISKPFARRNFQGSQNIMDGE